MQKRRNSSALAMELRLFALSHRHRRHFEEIVLKSNFLTKTGYSLIEISRQFAPILPRSSLQDFITLNSSPMDIALLKVFRVITVSATMFEYMSSVNKTSEFR